MAKTCVQLISRVKQLIGRTGAVNVNTLDIDNIILDALNDAQVQIVRQLPHISDLQVKDTTTLDTVQDQYEYSLSGFSPAIAHLQNIWILNGTSSRRIKYLHKDTFDRQWPDVSAVAASWPDYYTRRGNTIEFNCPISSDCAGLDVRVDYCKWAAPFTDTASTQTSELVNADRGLILYAWSDTLRVIARGNQGVLAAANEKRAWFDEWLDEYADYHDMLTEDLKE